MVHIGLGLSFIGSSILHGSFMEPSWEILKKPNPTHHHLTLEVNPIPHGGSCRNVPPYQEIVGLDYFILDPCIYCSAWLRLKLITKITLDTI